MGEYTKDLGCVLVHRLYRGAQRFTVREIGICTTGPWIAFWHGSFLGMYVRYFYRGCRWRQPHLFLA